MSPRRHELLALVSSLPHKILMHHGNDHITELVLHDLCSNAGFNLSRAAYFVDNPDFDCLKGVIGFHTGEVCSLENPWNNPTALATALLASPFNQQVRSTTLPSPFKKGLPREELVESLAKNLGIQNPGYCSWNMKHDNHGLLVFEKTPSGSADIDECLEKGASILGFCPIY